MNGTEESKILVAIARLEEKHEHLETYIFKDLKADIERLCNKVTECMEKAEECSRRNLKWMVGCLISVVAASLGWAAFFLGTS